MNTDIEERCIMVANYIAEEKATVRSAALHFGVSKSTVHKDVAERLKYINRRLYDEVKKILKENKEERHIRGGMATKKKYEEKRDINKKTIVIKEFL